MIEIKAPEFPESIADGEIAAWHVSAGEAGKRDQELVDIETDTSNRICVFKLTKPDVDYQAKLAEFAETNKHLAGYEIQ